MTKLVLMGALLALSAASCLAATTGSEPLLDPQLRPWSPAAPAEQVALWPAGLAIAAPANPGAEIHGLSKGAIAGKPITMVQHVSRPTMSIYRPTAANTGAAVVVFPGGGYRVLAIDLEGTEICEWLVAKGITCVVLKYRVPGSGPYWADECNCRRAPAEPMALQDAQRAIALLRERAASLGVDPHRIGVIGFSAGGRMVADVSNHAEHAYAAVDAADRQSSRPDFAMALYPGHLWAGKGTRLDLTHEVQVDPAGPPTLLLQAGDDATDDVRESLTYYLALQQAGVPAELHLYARGGHAFGVRETGNPITRWPALAEAWMRQIEMLAAP